MKVTKLTPFLKEAHVSITGPGVTSNGHSFVFYYKAPLSSSYLLWDWIQVLSCGNCHNRIVRWLSQQWHTAETNPALKHLTDQLLRLIHHRHVACVCTWVKGSRSRTSRGCPWCSWEEEAERGRPRTAQKHNTHFQMTHGTDRPDIPGVYCPTWRMTRLSWHCSRKRKHLRIPDNVCRACKVVQQR